MTECNSIPLLSELTNSVLRHQKKHAESQLLNTFKLFSLLLAYFKLLDNHNIEIEIPKGIWELQLQVFRYSEKLTKILKYTLPHSENRSQVSCLLRLSFKCNQAPFYSSAHLSVSNHPI